MSSKNPDLQNVFNSSADVRILRPDAGTKPGGDRFAYTVEGEIDGDYVVLKNTGSIAITGINDGQNLFDGEPGPRFLIRLRRDQVDGSFVRI